MQGKEAHAAEAKSTNPSDCKQDFAFSPLSPTPRMGMFDLFIPPLQCINQAPK